MDIVLGVSMTPTTVRMVLVEGEKADGLTVDHDVFDVASGEGSATSNAAEQVIAAVLGTKESAEAGGHHLKSIGVTWSDHTEASVLRDTLTARGIDDVMLVSDGHAAAALAQAVGRAVGYETTALLFIDRDTATLSVVKTDDGSVVKVLSSTLHSSDAMAVLTEMAAAVDAQESPPQAMFVVGSGVDVSAVKTHLEHLVSLPVSAPDEPELALARGAALASANAPGIRGLHGRPRLLPGSRRHHCGGRLPRPFRRGNAARAGRRCGSAGAGLLGLPAGNRSAADRGGTQTVPARRQCADVYLRGWRCGTGYFARSEHQANGRPAAEPRRERDRAEHRGARRAAARAGGTAARGPAATAAGDHQGAGSRGAGSSAGAAADRVRRAAARRPRLPRRHPRPRRLPHRWFCLRPRR